MASAKICGDFAASHAHLYQYFDNNAFFQGKMRMGHSGLLLAGWWLALPTLPEFRCVLLTLHAVMLVHFECESTPQSPRR